MNLGIVLGLRHPMVHRWYSTAVRRVLAFSLGPFLPVFGATHADRGPAGLSSSPVDDYVVRQWTVEDGLPYDQVNCLLATGNGFLWIGTQRGLVRYDGTDMVILDRAGVPGMDGSAITSMAEGPDGALWLGSLNGLLRLADDGSVEVWDREAGFRNPAIFSILPVTAEDVWIGTAAGLARWRDGRIEIPPAGTLVGQYAIRAIAPATDGWYWIGTSLGILRIDPAKAVEDSWGATPVIKGGGWAFARRETGEYWVVGGLFTHEARGHLLTTRGDTVAVISDGMIGNGGRSIFGVAVGGESWISGGPGHLLRIDSEGTSGRMPVPALGTDFAICAACDHEGNVWLGTENSGLLQLRPRVARETGPAHDLRTVLETGDGRVWVAGPRGLWFREGDRPEAWVEVRAEPALNVRALAEDASGRLWIGLHNGLALWEGGTLRRFRIGGDPNRNKVNGIVTSDTGLWVSTIRGVHGIPFEAMPAADGGAGAGPDDAGGAVVVLEPGVSMVTTEVEAQQDISAVCLGAQGELWIGTRGLGMFEWSPDEGLRAWTHEAGIPGSAIRSLRLDRDERLWVATEAGVAVIRRDGGRDAIRTLTHRNGLLRDDVVEVLDAGDDGVWLATLHGLQVLERAPLESFLAGEIGTVTPRWIDCAEGLGSVDFTGEWSQPAAVQCRDGRLLFATARGLAEIDPRRLDPPRPPGSVQVDRVRANGVLVLDRMRGSRRGGIESIDPVPGVSGVLRFIPGSARVLEFQYTAPTFHRSGSIEFETRLAGLHDEWHPKGTMREAYYANLKPGAYRFEVRARHPGTDAITHANPMPFVIRPFLVETAGFRAGVVAAVVLGLVGGMRWRLSKERRIRTLEAEAAALRERMRIGRDLHDGLGGDLTYLAMLADELANGAATRRGSVESLPEALRRPIQRLRDLVSASSPGSLALSTLVIRLGDRMAERARAAGLECRLRLPKRIPDLPVGANPRQHLDLIFEEAFTNVLKHAGATRVTFEVAVDDLHVALRLDDNGNGLPHPEGREGGHGLGNLRVRAESMGGTAEFGVRKEGGARIQVVLPMEGLR
ncbi:MAG: hypothetical protein KF833_23925 [Verrucomicrobiae bacterium]|nr:hypothetical protein [Verrucomicrobiae bacterium]